MRPGEAALLAFAAQRIAPNARVLWIGSEAVTPVSLATRTILRTSEEDAIPAVEAQSADPVDAILAPWPATYAPLMRFLTAAHAALREGGEAIVCDLVWQTAPTPELMRAFAPTPGRERVRPIEGYEMQAEHCGFAIKRTETIDRAQWAPMLPPEQRAAVEGDTRGAARLAMWALRRSDAG